MQAPDMVAGGDQDLLLDLTHLIAEDCPDADSSRNDQHEQHDPQDVLLGQQSHGMLLSGIFDIVEPSYGGQCRMCDVKSPQWDYLYKREN